MREPHETVVEGLEDALRKEREEVQALRSRLEQKIEELRRVARARERFLSSMSHELRTPLTAVLGYSHLLLDGVAGEMNEQQRSFVDRTRAAAQNLNALLDDILDLAKLETGTLELNLAQTNIRPMLEDIAATLASVAAASDSRIEIETGQAPEFITTDARAVRQILLSLTAGGLRSGAGAPVILRCARTGEKASFEVEDHGPGMTEEEAAQVFEEFLPPSAAHGRKGSGLRLAVSRQLAERLGGSLSVVSKPGRGTTFRLELPVTGPAES